MKKVFQSLILVVLCCMSGHLAAQNAVITIGESGYATFSSDKALDFSKVTGENGKTAELTAFIGSSFFENGYLAITKAGGNRICPDKTVNPNIGLIVKGKPGIYHVQYADGATNYFSSLLTPTVEPATLQTTDGATTTFVLTEDGCFSPVTNGDDSLGPNSAYLKVPTKFCKANHIEKFMLGEVEEEKSIKVKQ